MPAYAAFLRGVMPTNCKMPELRQAFESAGFGDVRTVLGSGNVVFTSRAASVTSLERKAERAMEKALGHSFLTIVRPMELLREILDSDPYAGFRLPPAARRVVTFLRVAPPPTLTPPVEVEGARILAMYGPHVFTVYTPTPGGPVFMTLIEKMLGKEVTTRTWETLGKVAR